VVPEVILVTDLLHTWHDTSNIHAALERRVRGVREITSTVHFIHHADYVN